MFAELEKINACPKPFEFYTAEDLWTDEHTSRQMLAFHLNESVDISSRKAAFMDRSVDWIVRRFSVGAGTKIADFGCGPGLYVNRLARCKADVTGIDFSKRSIAYAREVAEREGLSVRLANQNYLEFQTDIHFHLIIMIMCDFCALSPAQRKQMLLKFHDLLEDGGSVLLDVYSYAAFDERVETAGYEVNQLNGFWSANKYYGFQNTFKYEQEKVVLDKYTIIEADRIRTVYNWLQYFSREGLADEFRSCGLHIREYLADVAGSPFNPNSKEFAVVAGKL